jgi:hypothetical protein
VADLEKWHFDEGKALEDLLNEELDADPSTDGFVYLDFWETSGWLTCLRLDAEYLQEAGLAQPLSYSVE